MKYEILGAHLHFMSILIKHETYYIDTCTMSSLNVEFETR